MTGPNANLPNGSELVSIPLGNDLPWYTITIGLSGVQYLLRLRYNTRSSQWIMDIATPLNVDILDSIPLLIGRNLTAQFLWNTAMPPGIFFVLDSTGEGNQPTRYSFGTTHTLYYVDPLAVT